MNITLTAGKSYKLGAGVYVLTNSVEVDANSALW
jgi:hypothetical protein